jgi:hypothetical protein
LEKIYKKAFVFHTTSILFLHIYFITYDMEDNNVFQRGCWENIGKYFFITEL